ncbi:LAMI_0H15522g1_1 [Lachancea mirantina]|uniref:LAMI_0H15522g1_1 n=1 Tax=Lachancea mirantina TaxID=1230905 RepID=A0A1G4KIZ4_9SACH|nr:LAMI_0H15522g1_1 [Lachancea mirantina]
MSGTIVFRRVPLSESQDFSWVFLVDWILLAILSLAAVFYFGRAFAFCITFIMEWLIWKRYKVKISVQALKISFLAGRIFFKNLTITTQNQTLSFLDGCFTWRYWLINPRLTQLENSESETDSIKNQKLPCRLRLDCNGFEHFIYNKTSAFESILESLSQDDRETFRRFFDDTDSEASEKSGSGGFDADSSTPKSQSETSSTSNSLNDRDFQKPDSRPSFLGLLPIQFHVKRGALVLGNLTTPSVLVATYDTATGLFDASAPDEKLDLYKMRLQFHFRNYRASLLPNIPSNGDDHRKSVFTSSQLQTLSNMVKDSILSRSFPRKRLDQEQNNAKFVEHWSGLGLYHKSSDSAWNDEFQFDVSKHDYAKYTKILKCDEMIMSYSLDMPGVVPHGALRTEPQLDGPDVGNNGAPPDYSLDFQIFGATVYYGPWAHHQILPLQRILSPVLSRDGIPIKKLLPGARRIHTRFRITLQIMSDSVWRVPTREPSKDLEFLKRYKETEDETRPFGWLDVTVNKASEICLNIAMCPTTSGYSNFFTINLHEPELRTSVNHDILLSAKSQEIRGQVGYPLGWNAQATWVFDFSSHQAQIFLLRDHITLLSDMMSDFSSGQSTPYELFRPFVYELNWKLNGYSLYLNVNDGNIVNNPLDFSENCYLSLHGDDMEVSLSIPMETISQSSTEISFELFTSLFRLQLNTPSWNTLNEFMTAKEVGISHDFKMTGSYLFYSKLDVDNIDTIIIDCHSKYTILQCYGFVIRYLIGVKMNYFGDFIHFKTTEEYMEEFRGADINPTDKGGLENKILNSWTGDAEERTTRNDAEPQLSRSSLKRIVNEKDVWFTFIVDDGCLVLPSNLYSSTTCFGLHFDILEIDVRYVNYYMDLQAALSPTRIKFHPAMGSLFELSDQIRKSSITNFEGRISDLHIHGHRLFGLPSDEETYFCKWDFRMGTLSVSSDISFLTNLASAFRKLAFGYKDFENTISYSLELITDMTSVTFYADKAVFKINELETETCTVIEMAKLKLSLIDFENVSYSKRTEFHIPSLKLSVLKQNGDKVLAQCFTSILATNFDQYKNRTTQRELQQSHLTRNDAPFHRCPFLLPPMVQDSFTYKELFGAIPPGMSIPPLVKPITPTNVDEVLDAFSKTDPFLGEYLQNEMNSKSFLQQSSEGKATSFAEHDQVGWYLEPKDTCQCDNIILNLGKTILAIQPDFTTVLQKLGDRMYRDAVDDLIDRCELDVVIKFMRTMQELNSTKKMRAVCESFQVIYGEIINLDDMSFIDHLQITVENLDASFSVDMKVDPTTGPSTTAASYLIRAGTISTTFFQKSLATECPPILAAAAEEIEVWTEEISGTRKLSTSAKGLDMSVNPDELKWLTEFTMDLFAKVTNTYEVFSLYSKSLENAKRQLFYRIALASDEYQITHDPPVLTKPAYIMRLSSHHVRENRSWRIVTRVRHILNYLPHEWSVNCLDKLRKKDFQTPLDAGSIFLKVFSSWRSWEFSDVEKCYIYKTTFLPDLLHSPKELSEEYFKLILNTVAFNISKTPHVEGDSVVIKGLRVLQKHQAVSEGVGKDSSKKRSDKHLFEKNVACNLKSIKGSVGESFLMLGNNVAQLVRKFSSPTVPSPSKLKLHHLTCLCDRLDIQVYIDKSRLALKSFSNSITFLTARSHISSKPLCSASCGWARSETSLRYENSVVLEHFMRNGIVGFSSMSKEEKCIFRLDISSQKSRLKSSSDSAKIISFFDNLQASYERLSEALLCNQAENIGEKPSLDVLGMFDDYDCSVRFRVSEHSSELRFTSPLIIAYHVKEIDFLLDKADMAEATFSLKGLDSEIRSKIAGIRYFKYSQSEIETKATVIRKGATCFDVAFKIFSKLAKLKTFDPRELLLTFMRDLESAKDHIAQMKESILSVFGEKTQSKTPSLDVDLRWSLQLDFTYFGILFPLARTNYVLEINTLNSNLFERRLNHERKMQLLHDVLGNCSAESIALLIDDTTVKSHLSKVLDFALKVAVSRETHHKLKSIQVESSHFRVCLCPFSTIKLIWLVQEFLRLKEILASARAVSQQIDDETPLFPEFSSILHSIHLLSYNFCFGWLFDGNDCEDPGLIYGFQRLFAAYESPFGKLTVLEAYLSLARGHTSSTFFSQKSERDQINRSYLPSVQAGYWFVTRNNHNDLFIRINGERLDVNFLSSSIGVCKGIIKSLHTFQELKKSLEPPSNIQNAFKRAAGRPIGKQYSFLRQARRVNCKIHYAGGIFKLYSLHDYENGLTPCLELESPSVHVSLDYENFRHELKNHWLRGMIQVEPSHNKVYPFCVPVLSEMARDLRHILKTINLDQSNGVMPGSESVINYKTMLQSFDIAIIFDVGKQKISLSCEPKAKIQADVGFEQLDLKLFTNNLAESEPLSLCLDIYKLKASSRHVFSREVSTSFTLDSVSAVVILTHPDVIHTYGFTHIPSVEIYFNYKQLQDVDLFLNIWKVGSHIYSEPELREKSSRNSIKLDQPFVFKSKAINGNQAIPWNYVLVVSSFKGDIDLGPSLGLMSLRGVRFWAVTDHYKNWTQQLSINLETIKLLSDGRLGGEVLLQDLSWASQLSWPVFDGEFQSPLVDLSLNLVRFAIKMSFDYHLILISSVDTLKARLFNERDEMGVLKDLLTVALSCTSVQIFFTALAPANVLDIFNTIKRMRQDNRKSYLETLRESNTKESADASQAKFGLSSFLRTDMTVNLKFIHVQIFPSTLFDIEVLIFRAKDIFTHTEIEAQTKVRTQLTWQVNDAKISLSTYKNQLNEDISATIDVDSYIQHASRVHGGTLLVTPTILIGMTTWHDVETNIVEYLYSNSFGGKIRVRWNLGSINFIREMWATHVRALALRRAHVNHEKSFFEDENLEDKLKDFDLGDKYVYVPIEEPHIEIPQIKDLGDATPPVEWFGVNRRRFPGITHQTIIVPLQKSAHLAEKEWARVIGNA